MNKTDESNGGWVNKRVLWVRGLSVRACDVCPRLRNSLCVLLLTFLEGVHASGATYLEGQGSRV